jgi:hypothetical protein
MTDGGAGGATDRGADRPGDNSPGDRARGGLLFNGVTTGGGPEGEGGDGEDGFELAHDWSPVRSIKRQRGRNGSLAHPQVTFQDSLARETRQTPSRRHAKASRTRRNEDAMTINTVKMTFTEPRLSVYRGMTRRLHRD